MFFLVLQVKVGRFSGEQHNCADQAQKHDEHLQSFLQEQKHGIIYCNQFGKTSFLLVLDTMYHSRSWRETCWCTLKINNSLSINWHREVKVFLTNENAGSVGRALRSVLEPLDEDEEVHVTKHCHQEHHLWNELQEEVNLERCALVEVTTNIHVSHDYLRWKTRSASHTCGWINLVWHQKSCVRHQ